MPNLDRFQPPTARDELAECAVCERRLHYTLLNDDGLCPDCIREQEEAFEQHDEQQE